MSFADNYEAYLDWAREQRTPEEFDRIRQARSELDGVLAVFYELEEPTPGQVRSAVDKVRKARDLI